MRMGAERLPSGGCIRLPIILSAIFLLAACSEAPIELADTNTTPKYAVDAAYRNQPVSLAQKMMDADHDMTACSDRAFAALRGTSAREHQALNPTNATASQLQDTVFVPAVEEPVFYKFHDAIGICEQQFVRAYGILDPALSQIIFVASERTDDAILALAERKIAWGDYNRQMREIVFDFGQADMRERARISQRLREAEADSSYRRQRGIAEFAKGLSDAGDAMQHVGDVYGQAARNVAAIPPPAPPQVSDALPLENYYQRPSPPTGCIGYVPVIGPGLNRCP